MAKLTMINKYKIQQFLAKGHSAGIIANKLKLTEKVIQNYLDTELKDLVDSFNETHGIWSVLSSTSKDTVSEQSVLESVEPPTATKSEVTLEQNVFDATVYKLKTFGIKNEQAVGVLNRIVKELKSPISDVELLASLCMQKLEVQQAMITTAVGGREGVTIMTQTASEIAEHRGKTKHTRVPSNTKDYIHNPKTA